MAATFPYFRPKRSTKPPAEPEKAKAPQLYRNLDAKQRVLRMAGFKRQRITLPKVNLPE